jgi:alkylation response protein AidB-like acyl-CoA dehydrogenase
MTAVDTVGSRVRFAGPVHAGSAELRRLIGLIDDEVLARDRENRAPHAEFDLIREARLGALRVPVARGGTGASLRELFETVIALSEADPNVAHSLRNHFVFVESRLRFGQGGAADGWLRRVVDGAIFGAAATELGASQIGRRDQSLASTLTPAEGGGYLLNGTKFYSTGNLYADWLIVSAQHPDGTGVRVAVPTGRPGVVLEDDWDGIGQRLSGSGTTRLVDVRVAPGEVLTGPDLWSDGVPYPATLPQLYLTAVIAGILRRVTRDAVALVHGRARTYYHAPTERAAEDPILQQTVGYLASNAYAAETLVLAAADVLGAATDAVHNGALDHELALQASLRAAKAKVVVDELGQRTASMLFDVGGATAVRQVKQLDRHWRNIRTLASHNPSTYKAKWIGGYELNGTPLPGDAFF